MENTLRFTGHCGLYCKDCIFFESEAARLAKALLTELEGIEFGEYAGIQTEMAESTGKESPIGSYEDFRKTLAWLGGKTCTSTCREGSDNCGFGRECPMRVCAIDSGLEGCWECPDLDACEHLALLAPVCGETPRENGRIIRDEGWGAFETKRLPFYSWKREGAGV